MTARPLGLVTVWRRHLRRFGTGPLLALVTGLTTLLVIGAPRVADTAYDRALGDQLRSAPYGLRDIQLSYTEETQFGFYVGLPVNLMGGRPTSPRASVDKETRSLLGPTNRLVRSGTFSAQTKPNSVTILDAHGQPRPGQEAKQAIVRLQSDFAPNVRWDAGGMPGRPTTTTEVPYRLQTETGFTTVSRPVDVIPIAMASAVARAWDLTVGDRIRLDSAANTAAYDTPQPIVVDIAGTFTPLDASASFWDAEARMLQPAVIPAPGPGGGFLPQIVLVSAPENYGALGSSMFPRPTERDFVPPGTSEASPGLTHEWRYVLDDRALTRTDADALADAVSRLNLARAEWGPAIPHVATGLLDVLRAYDRAVAVTAALLLFVVLALVAAAALAMSRLAVALVEERRPVLTLLRSRGGSLGQLARVTLGDALVWLVPAVVLGAGLAVWLAPGVSRAETVLLAVAPPVGVVLASLAATVGMSRGTRTGPTTASRAAQARRIAVELLVLAGAYFVVGSVRSRGEQIRAGTSDWIAALTPMFVALAAAVVLLRVYPWAIRAAARAAARRRSVFGFLGLARAAREDRSTLLPVAVLVVAATVTTMLATIGASVDRARLEGTYRSVGADVRIDAIRIDATDLAPLRGRAGVRGAVSAYVSGTQVTGRSNLGNENVTVVATDPGAYAALLAGTPLAFAAARLSGAAGADGAVPALVSNPLRLPGVDFQVLIDGTLVPIHVAGVQPGLTRGSADRAAVPTLLLPLDALVAAKRSTQPNTVFLAADDAAAAALVHGAPPTTLTREVVGRADLERSIAGRALPRLVQATTLAGPALGGLFAGLAALQLLAATRRSRTEAMVRLRTMGLARGGEWRLGVVEVFPVALAAILTGVAAGIWVPHVLTGILDLSPYTGGPAYPPVTPSARWLAGIVGGLLGLVVLALVIDGVRARRTRLADHLRAGDQR